MKKTIPFLAAAVFLFALGGFAQFQDQAPPPPKPVAVATPAAPAPIVQAVPHPGQSAMIPHPAPPAQTLPHPAVSGQTPHPVSVLPAAAPAALAVQQTPPPKEAAAPRTVAHPPDQAQTAPPAKAVAGMRTEIIKFKYADLFAVNSLLNAYKSVYGRVSITSQSDKTIVVTDTPEIVEKMISLVRDIDVKPVEIQFTVQLIQGNEAEGPGDESLKNDPVIRELRSVLRYKSFSLLDGTLMRVIDGIESETKFGPKGEYALRLEPKYVKDGAAETIQTRIQLRKPEWINQKITHTEKKEETQSMQMYYNNLIQTSLQLKAGEKTVVGVSKSDADKGLILILSAKIIR